MSSAPLRLVSSLVLACLLGGHALHAGFVERFDQVNVGRSIYVSGGTWRKFGSGEMTQPAGNTAIVGSENGRRHLTITGFGHPKAGARAFANVDLPVTPTSNRVIACSLRAVSPGSAANPLTNVNVALNASRGGAFDPDGGLGFGIVNTNTGPVFFFDFGKGNRVQSRTDTTPVDPSAWYRFTVELDPVSGVASFSVHALVDGKKGPVVWSGTSAGLPRFSPQSFSQINFMVSRPGTNPEKSRSADFADLSITP